MKFWMAARLLAPTAMVVAAVPAAWAQDDLISNGTYEVDGGGYQITVRREGTNVVVLEPNKRSVYERQPDGTWHFRNEVNGILYGLRRVDAATIEAFKPDQPNAPPTRLSRQGGAPAVMSTEVPPSVAAENPASVGEVAKAYQQRAAADPDNAQTWTACAAAAHKRFTANAGEADAFGAQMASLLKLIIVDASRTPCPDAISQTVWDAGKSPPAAALAPAAPRLTAAQAAADAAAAKAAAEAAAEAERVRQLNLLADQRAKALEAERQRQVAEHAKAVAEAEARQAQYQRDRAAFEEAQAKADAAAEAYRRQIEDYERTYGRRP